MLRFFIIPVLLFTAIIGDCKEMSEKIEALNLHNESLALVYIGSGNECLLMHNYVSAIKDFQKAAELLNSLETRVLEMEFFVSFGQAIAYDNLGMQDQCERSIGSLLFILNEGSLETDDSPPNGSEELLPQEYTDATQRMKQLANLAQTLKIREMLLAIVEELSQELSSQFRLSESASYMQGWEYDYNNDGATALQPCKSFWKRAEKFVKRTCRVILKAKVVWELIKDIDRTLRN